MVSLGTSAAVWPAHQALGLISRSSDGRVEITLRAVTGKAGENAVAHDVADRRPGASTIATEVTLEIGGNHLTLEPAGPLSPGTIQRFVAKSLVELPEGKSAATYSITRPAYTDVTGTIPLDVPPALQPGATGDEP